MKKLVLLVVVVAAVAAVIAWKVLAKDKYHFKMK